MIQQVTVLTTKADDVSSIPRAHIVERETQLPTSWSLNTTHVMDTYIHAYTPTHKINESAFQKLGK